MKRFLIWKMHYPKHRMMPNHRVVKLDIHIFISDLQKTIYELYTAEPLPLVILILQILPIL